MRVSTLLASTIRKLGSLKNTNPEQEALDILSSVLSKSRSWLYTHGDETVNARDNARIKLILFRRLNGEPLAYVLGKMVFGDLTLAINRSVLVPRPATEILINAAEKLIDLIPKAPPPCHCESIRQTGSRRSSTPPVLPLARGGEGGVKVSIGLRSLSRAREGAYLAMTNEVHIIEVGTGSGVIAISLGLYCQNQKIAASITASDISPAALKVAQRNIAQQNLKSVIQVRRANLLAAAKKPADIIVANLPYLSPKDARGLADPRPALVGGRNGDELITALLGQISRKKILKPQGAIALEIGHAQADSITRQAKKLFPGARVRIVKDFEGWPRILTIQLP